MQRKGTFVPSFQNADIIFLTIAIRNKKNGTDDEIIQSGQVVLNRQATAKGRDIFWIWDIFAEKAARTLDKTNFKCGL